MMPKIESEILEALKIIVNNPIYSSFPNQFAFPTCIEEDSLLFIGLNPSFSSEIIQFDSYSLKQKDNKHSYFSKFEDISEYCNEKWSHIDLLFFRETNQSNVVKILKEEHGCDFIFEQLKISDKIIKNSNPKVIIVCNTLSRLFLGKDKKDGNNVWLNYDFIFNEEFGTYFYGKIPVFFTSMLTGQRALDLGSFERLKWHIKRTLYLKSLASSD